MKRTHVYAAIAAGLMVGSGLLFIDRAPPFRYLESRFEPAVIEPGGTMRHYLKIEWRRRDCAVTLTRAVTDYRGALHKMETIVVPPAPVGKREGPPIVESWRQVTVPRDLPPGPANYEPVAYMRCGLIDGIWPIRVDPIPMPFTVL